jgi:hypothetical protein
VYSQVLERGTRPSGGWQGIGQFVAGDPRSGYYNDLRGLALSCEWARAEAADAVAGIERDMATSPVRVLQVGLGAWQLTGGDPRWSEVVGLVADSVSRSMDDRGRLAYRRPMPHTYNLPAPWFSAMAQGQAGSLLVRAALTLGRPELLARAREAMASLQEPPLLVHTSEGPVLQEYPTTPPAHVLNGWIFALWGLYDVMTSSTERQPWAEEAFHDGVDTLSRRLALYETAHGWSRYDLYPHRLTNVASPFYHHLHVAQLRAMASLVPGEPAFAQTAERWARALDSRLALGLGLTRKVAFRIVVPRWRAI